MKILISILFIYQLLYIQVVSSAKRWSEKDIARLEREELDLAYNPNEIDKPGMVFAHFASHLTKEETGIIAQRFQVQLLSAGVRTQIFETHEKEWVVTTYRERDATDVVKYLREQPEVMKVVIDAREYWQLPKYQKEYEADILKKQKEGKPLSRPGKIDEEELKRRAMDALAKKDMEEQKKTKTDL